MIYSSLQHRILALVLCISCYPCFPPPPFFMPIWKTGTATIISFSLLESHLSLLLSFSLIFFPLLISLEQFQPIFFLVAQHIYTLLYPFSLFPIFPPSIWIACPLGLCLSSIFFLLPLMRALFPLPSLFFPFPFFCAGPRKELSTISIAQKLYYIIKLQI